MEALQQIVWPGDNLEIVPAHVLLTAAHNGGLVAGAWVGEGLAGFVFGFLGFDGAGQARRLKHCSHMLGVHPDFRSAGVGYTLKAYQREHVLRQGLDLITWTYDPLLARNAQLNIAKLGAVCKTYLPNLYGRCAMASTPACPPTASRWTGGSRPRGWLTAWAAHRAVAREWTTCRRPARPGSTRPDPMGLPQPPNPSRRVDAETSVLVEIPADFLALKRSIPPRRCAGG